MAAGRPTVLAIDGVIRQVVESARGGIFVAPGDDAALAEAIQRLSANREWAKSMGTSARSYVAKNFNRAQQAVDFENLMLRLAQGVTVLDSHSAPFSSVQ